jgi:hypothetical protein
MRSGKEREAIKMIINSTFILFLAYAFFLLNKHNYYKIINYKNDNKSSSAVRVQKILRSIGPS